MDIQQLLHGLAERVSSSASVKNIYGDSVTVGDRTVIPVAQIHYAFGGGGGLAHHALQSEGGGGGAHAFLRPYGAIEITPSGTRFLAFDDRRRRLAALAIGFVIGIAVAGRRLKA